MGEVGFGVVGGSTAPTGLRAHAYKYMNHIYTYICGGQRGQQEAGESRDPHRPFELAHAHTHKVRQGAGAQGGPFIITISVDN